LLLLMLVWLKQFAHSFQLPNKLESGFRSHPLYEPDGTSAVFIGDGELAFLLILRRFRARRPMSTDGLSI
jgi:hypothetical protein